MPQGKRYITHADIRNQAHSEAKITLTFEMTEAQAAILRTILESMHSRYCVMLDVLRAGGHEPEEYLLQSHDATEDAGQAIQGILHDRLHAAIGTVCAHRDNMLLCVDEHRHDEQDPFGLAAGWGKILNRPDGETNDAD